MWEKGLLILAVLFGVVGPLFDEGSGYQAQSIDMIRLRERHEQTGALTCDAEIIDNENDKWQVTYQISKDETDPLGYIVQAQWNL